MADILIVDDEVKLGKLLVESLASQGHQVVRASSGPEALGRMETHQPDLVVTDLRMPGTDGVAVLRAVKQRWPDTEVVVMTAFASAESAVDAMREGAADYLIKPFALDEFRMRVAHILERRALSTRAEALARRLDEAQGFASLVATSDKMQAVLDQARRVAETDETVLLVGESGVGKTALARALHQASRRADGPLVEVNCAALPEALLESELFGHERGAYTGAHQSKAGPSRWPAGAPCSSTRSATCPRPSGQTPAFPAGPHLQPPRRHHQPASGRARGGRHQPRLAGGHAWRGFPRGPLLPADGVPHRGAAAARAPRGHPCHRRRHSCAAGAYPPAGCRRRHRTGSRATAGRATSASWRTSSLGPSSSRERRTSVQSTCLRGFVAAMR